MDFSQDSGLSQEYFNESNGQEVFDDGSFVDGLTDFKTAVEQQQPLNQFYNTLKNKLDRVNILNSEILSSLESIVLNLMTIIDRFNNKILSKKGL